MKIIEEEILSLTSAVEITSVESVQTLWSGYGEVLRYGLSGGDRSSVIVKHIQLPEAQDHPRGWNTETSHKRKQRSYQVETLWYERYTQLTNDKCRVPKALKVMNKLSEVLIVMEDLNDGGYGLRLEPGAVSMDDAKHCLSWLAHFHSKFLDVAPEGLWPVGTYWHLETRPDEYEHMRNVPLKEVAGEINLRLNEAKFKTIVHGDAKLANFCFSNNGRVAAVDFQYVGGGCGMKDVAYFISSCFHEEEIEQYEEQLLTHYFEELKGACEEKVSFPELKKEWLALYKYAWADFYRFLDGWSPGHWKMHGYSAKLTAQVIKELKSI